MPYSQMAAAGQQVYNDWFRQMVEAAREGDRLATNVGEDYIPTGAGGTVMVPIVAEAGLQEPMFTPGDIASVAGKPAMVAAKTLYDLVHDAARNQAIRSEVASALTRRLEDMPVKSTATKATVRKGATQTGTAPAKPDAPAQPDYVMGSEPQFRRRTIEELFAHTDPAMEYLRRAYEIPEWTPAIYRSVRDMLPYQHIWDRRNHLVAIQNPARGIDMDQWADKYLNDIWNRIHSGAIDPSVSEFQMLQDFANGGVPAWRWSR